MWSASLSATVPPTWPLGPGSRFECVVAGCAAGAVLHAASNVALYGCHAVAQGRVVDSERCVGGGVWLEVTALAGEVCARLVTLSMAQRRTVGPPPLDPLSPRSAARAARSATSTARAKHSSRRQATASRSTTVKRCPGGGASRQAAAAGGNHIQMITTSSKRILRVVAASFPTRIPTRSWRLVQDVARADPMSTLPTRGFPVLDEYEGQRRVAQRLAAA